MLGCDGANSIVRSRSAPHATISDSSSAGSVVDVATTAELDQLGGRPSGLRPRAGRYVHADRRDALPRGIPTAAMARPRTDFATLDALGPLIRPWVQHVSGAELRLVRVAEYTFRAQIADRWRRGRIFLLGDAAHLTPPFIGQGIGRRTARRDEPGLETRRRADVRPCPATSWKATSRNGNHMPRHMIRLALAVGRAMTAGGEFGNHHPSNGGTTTALVAGPEHQSRRQRDTGVATFGARPEAQEAPATGRKALPESIGGRMGHGLTLALGDGFAVITRTAPSATECALAEKRGAVVHVAAPDSELATWLCRGRADAAIIRPDRTVMRAGRDLAVLFDSLPSSCSGAIRKAIPPQ